MEGKKYLLFDLDGTITASDDGITRSVQYALSKFGIEVADLNELKPFVGPPLRVAFPKYYGLSKEETEQAVTYYRSRYEKVGIFECSVYDGIPELLAKCASLGYVLLLATSKPRIYANRILEHFGIAKYFTLVIGCELDGTLDRKSEVIEKAVADSGCTDKAQFIMIGDRFYDIEGAKEAGVQSIGVLYGYGSKEELENEGADYICKSVSDLLHLLCGAKGNRQ